MLSIIDPMLYLYGDRKAVNALPEDTTEYNYGLSRSFGRRDVYLRLMRKRKVTHVFLAWVPQMRANGPFAKMIEVLRGEHPELFTSVYIGHDPRFEILRVNWERVPKSSARD